MNINAILPPTVPDAAPPGAPYSPDTQFPALFAALLAAPPVNPATAPLLVGPAAAGRPQSPLMEPSPVDGKPTAEAEPDDGDAAADTDADTDPLILPGAAIADPLAPPVQPIIVAPVHTAPRPTDGETAGPVSPSVSGNALLPAPASQVDIAPASAPAPQVPASVMFAAPQQAGLTPAPKLLGVADPCGTPAGVPPPPRAIATFASSPRTEPQANPATVPQAMSPSEPRATPPAVAPSAPPIPAAAADPASASPRVTTRDALPALPPPVAPAAPPASPAQSSSVTPPATVPDTRAAPVLPTTRAARGRPLRNDTSAPQPMPALDSDQPTRDAALTRAAMPAPRSPRHDGGLAAVTARIVDTGPGSFDIATDRLGAVRVAIDARDTRVGVQFTVDNPAAASLLGAQPARLADAVATSGSRLDGVSVDVRSGGGGASGNAGESGGGRPPGERRDPARSADPDLRPVPRAHRADRYA